MSGVSSTLDRRVISGFAPQVGLELHATLDSTQAFAHALVAAGQRGPLAILADEQTAGRGQRGRTWHSPPNAAVYLTLIWPSTRRMDTLIGLSLALGLAVRSTLAEVGIMAELKWPNDVLVDGRKIAGVLVDIVSSSTGSTPIIGIGLNLDLHPDDARQIDQATTDLRTHLSNLPSRSEMAGRLLRAVGARLQDFEQVGFAPMMKEWQAADALVGTEVEWSVGDSTQRARVLGIDALGRLRAAVDGKEKLIVAGDVRVRRVA